MVQTLDNITNASNDTVLYKRIIILTMVPVGARRNLYLARHGVHIRSCQRRILWIQARVQVMRLVCDRNGRSISYTFSRVA